MAAIAKLLGAGFYLTASVYMAVTKPLDITTMLAIAAGLIMAGLAITKYTDWAAIGGGMMIAVSLFLQSLLSYRCLDCIRADVLILAGVISLSVMEQGRHRRALGILSVIITIFVAATIAVHYDPPAVFGMEPAWVTVASPEGATGAACPEEDYGEAPGPAVPGETGPGQTSGEKTGGKQPEKADTPQPRPGVSGEPLKTAPEDPARFVQVIAEDGGIVTLDAAEKPVLFFTPTCGACVRAVEALAKADPEGNKWVPVQAYGDPARGGEMLKDKGYRGESYVYVSRWSGAVPMMVAVRNGTVYKTNSRDEMIRMAAD